MAKKQVIEKNYLLLSLGGKKGFYYFFFSPYAAVEILKIDLFKNYRM